MNAKDLTLNDCCQRKIVESVVEVVPNIMVAVFFCDLVIKSINIGNVTRLVIAPQQDHSLRVL